jgi:hypothetical protein
MKRLEDDTREAAKQQASQIHAERQKASPRVGELLLLYVDDTLEDCMPFGSVRLEAFRIMPKETLLLTGKLLAEKPVNQMELRWRAVDKQSGRCTKNLRPLVTRFRQQCGRESMAGGTALDEGRFRAAAEPRTEAA